MQREAGTSFAQDATSAASTVLAAEDIAVNQFLLQAFLDELGVCHQIVDNGRIAVEAFHETNFDLVLMDIRMPEMDGVAALREIRGSGAHGQSVPVIAMTAHSMDTEHEDLLASGFDAILGKPFTLDELRQLLTQFQVNVR